MKHTNGEKALVLALLACISACADSVSSPVGPGAPRDVRTEVAAASSSAERLALTRIARLVAVAMDNATTRQRIKRDMKAAPFREHKLQLGTYLRSNDGKPLLNRMVSSSGGTQRDLLATLDAIRPLEFYMPVARHRETWTGGAGVLVVSQLAESEAIVAFDERGREVALDRNVVPAQATLSIVPVETRFDQPMAVSTSKNVRDQNGTAIGTLAPINESAPVMCMSLCGGGGGGEDVLDPSTPYLPPPSGPTGLYLEFSRILDAKEPWFRGDPEIEVHIQGPTSPAAPTYAVDLSCSGEHAYDFRKVFDQNGGFWSGSVMLFSAAEIADYNSKFKDGFHVLFWEDDNTPCVLKLDTNSLVELLKSTAAAVSTVAIKVFPGASPVVIASLFLGTFFANAGSWMLTNDDFLGAAVDQTSAGYYDSQSTHVIMDGTRLNGRAVIVYR
jgi:hypothetical protein